MKKHSIVTNSVVVKNRHAVDNRVDIVIVSDYHLNQISFRWFDRADGAERTFSRPTTVASIEQVLADGRAVAAGRGGKVVWIMESTTGWARVKRLLGDRAQLLLANVLQIPLPPKARRKKTDKLDTARLLREYLHGALPLAHQPDDQWRSARRLVSLRESLVRRRTMLRNRITSYFSHETWPASQEAGTWSDVGVERLRARIEQQPESDRFVLSVMLSEMNDLEPRLSQVQTKLLELYQVWPDAQRIDAVDGIAEVAAVSIVARIGPIDRFASADDLIAYAGLAPGIHQSDSTVRYLSIGGGGTDKALRFYLMEASVWARRIPRYAATYERLAARRGKRIGRIAVARMMLRSIYKMLKEGVAFRPAA
jgi:transposase